MFQSNGFARVANVWRKGVGVDVERAALPIRSMTCWMPDRVNCRPRSWTKSGSV